MNHDFNITIDTAEEAIREVALIYLRHHGGTDSNAMHLTDHVMDALGRVEQEEAFEALSAAVERSFNRLRINGYRCEQDWECCMTCGWDAMPWADADHTVWYHSQDRDNAITSGKLMLVWQGDSVLIREAFEAEGLAVEHDGTVEKRFCVRLAPA